MGPHHPHGPGQQDGRRDPPNHSAPEQSEIAKNPHIQGSAGGPMKAFHSEAHLQQQQQQQAFLQGRQVPPGLGAAQQQRPEMAQRMGERAAKPPTPPNVQSHHGFPMNRMTAAAQQQQNPQAQQQVSHSVIYCVEE